MEDIQFLDKFKTNKSLKQYFSELIYKIGACESLKQKHPEYIQQFAEIFKRHPQYPDKFIGFNDIVIDYNHQFRTVLVVYIKKENGQLDDVSVLNQCVTGKQSDSLRTAMRIGILDQIYKYRRDNIIDKCQICSGTDYLEIDHHSDKTPFIKLVKDFLNQTSLQIPTSFDQTTYHMKCFKESDNIFEQEWAKYHKDNVILRVLCRHCNRSQPKYK